MEMAPPPTKARHKESFGLNGVRGLDKVPFEQCFFWTRCEYGAYLACGRLSCCCFLFPFVMWTM
jgi:hypothetical protein